MSSRAYLRHTWRQDTTDGRMNDDHRHVDGTNGGGGRHGHAPGHGRERVRGPGRAPPPRAARPLLPDARLVPGRRGRGAGDVPQGLALPRDLRGTLDRAGVALPHRHQHLPRPDRAAPARAGARRRGEVAAALPRQPPRRAARRRCRRPGEQGARAGDHRAGLRRRGAAPRPASARRADPPRRDGLAGQGGRHPARRLGELGQQCAAAGPRRDARAPAQRAAGVDR